MKSLKLYYPLIGILILEFFMIVFNRFPGIADDSIFYSLSLRPGWVPMAIDRAGGRLYPLNGFDLNLLTHFSTNITLRPLFYFNSLLFIIFTYLIFRIIKADRVKIKNTIWLFVLALSTSMIASTFTRLFVPEKMMLLLLPLLHLVLCSDYKFSLKTILLIPIILYLFLLKEPASLAILFSCLAVLFVNKLKGTKQFLFLAIMAVIYFVYFITQFYFKATDLYGATPFSIISLLKSIFVNFLYYPILFLFFIPFFLFRVRLIKNLNMYTVFWGTFSLIYTLIIVKLRIYSPHYLSVPTLAMCLALMSLDNFTVNSLLKKGLAFVVVLSLLNTVSDYAFFNTSSRNFFYSTQYLKDNFKKTQVGDFNLLGNEIRSDFEILLSYGYLTELGSHRFHFFNGNYDSLRGISIINPLSEIDISSLEIINQKCDKLVSFDYGKENILLKMSLKSFIRYFASNLLGVQGLKQKLVKDPSVVILNCH